MNESKTMLAGAGVILGCWTAYKLLKQPTSPNYPLPPSPRSYPIIGNLLSMPTQYEHIGFVEIGKQLHSDIFSLTFMGTLIVVLNSSEDAVNLLEKRSSIYSDRICPPMLGDPSLMDWSKFPTVLGYNDRWRKTRRLIHPWLHKKATENFHQSQQHQARLLLQRLLRSSDHLGDSEELEVEFSRSFSATLGQSIYGFSPHSSDDSLLTGLKTAISHAIDASLPSNFLVNIFPSLIYVPDWFPGTGWKRTAREWREQQKHAVNNSYNWAKTHTAEGYNESTIVAASIELAQSLELNPHEIDDYVKQLAVVLLAGGTDTTTGTLLFFALAMQLYPEVQKKAQNEIDAVIGLDRLPVMEDRAKLEYVSRVYKEVLRWYPVSPIGGPHACFQDDVYQGYRIPKGALVIGNAWAMTRNPKVYKDPEVFNPDRYLDPSVPAPPAFGFGRRSCPGVHYAESSLFIAIASLLAAFNIEKAVDENGNDVVSVVEVTNKITCCPKLFKLKLTPRSLAHEELVRAGA